MTVRPEERAAIEARVGGTQPAQVAGLAVTGMDQLDGYRFTLEGGWWLLIRFSGTEPLMRIYAEMPSMAQVQKALAEGQALAGVSL